MISYRIKNTVTGKYISHVGYRYIPHNDKRRKLQYLPTIDWKTSDEYGHSIEQINYWIKLAIEYKIQSLLDDCEIETIKRVYTQIKGSIRMKNVRDRHEKAHLIELLKK